ncbi:heme-binding protein [Aquibium sp. LZ166]|mgnify:CR=1 FL=1|uniref:Heme-binding protein n=1 Tax=Aquibium pacificus TaxID=3153579 RepID=A0ABV3SI71_9HYPH
MTSLTLATANAIIEGAFARGAELGLKPLGVSVLDAGGHLVAFQRQDGASFLRPQMSAGKAYGALSIGAGSRRLEAFAKERPHLMAGVSDVSGGRIVAVAGGVLILNRDGEIVGAVGISGDTSDNDEAAAVAGIEAAGFAADGG